jgi:hypothetical protein
MTQQVEYMQDQSLLVQGSMEWYQARLGKFTSSGVYALMVKARGLKEVSDTAMTYIYKIAAERNLKEKYKNEYVGEYIRRVSATSRAMDYGTENEDVARTTYIMKTGNKVVQCGFVNHSNIMNFGDSPDGIILDKNVDIPIGALEVKCPNPDTYLRYRTALKGGVPLKELKPEYYWQCVAHMMCNSVAWCDFVIFDKMQNRGIHIHRVDRDETDCRILESEIVKAERVIEKIFT